MHDQLPLLDTDAGIKNKLIPAAVSLKFKTL
jgi:hypothetical protein